MSPPATLPNDSSCVEAELLELYAKQRLRVVVPVMLAALLIATLAWDRAPRWLSVGWVSAVALMLLVSTVVRWWLPRMTGTSLRIRLGLTAAVSVMNGIVHGASVAFWPYLSDLERAVQSMFVLGLCAGSMAIEMGYLPVFVSYLLPIMTPLMVTWANALAGPGGAWYRGTAGMMMLVIAAYGGLLIVLARDTFGLYCHSFDTRRRLHLALEQAETANRAKTRFLASASHDLRQPMHTLTLFGAALAMRPLDDRTRSIAVQMNTALQALSSELDALLDVSKLDAGVVPVKPGSFSLSHLLRRLGDEFESVARRKGLRMVVNSVSDASCFTDPMLFERVMRNLIDNAIKYTAQGTVTLDAKRIDAGFELCVRDTGPGIPQAEHERVFEEFYQLDNAERDRAQGLGLGLSIVKRLADLLQLDMSMKSVPGKGTEFVLHVAEAAAPAGISPSAVSAPEASLDGLHVLVIDDEECVRHGMQTLLEGLGCRASLASGIDSAADLAARDRPDVVLTDFRLRGDENGIAAVQRLRELHPDLAALLISGDTAPARLREADAAGLRLLHKPVAVDLLTRAIREEMDRARPRPVERAALASMPSPGSVC
jgi:signal transduction histidine kinase/ActR/RegA family two-component response regulator